MWSLHALLIGLTVVYFGLNVWVICTVKKSGIPYYTKSSLIFDLLFGFPRLVSYVLNESLPEDAED